MDPETADTHDSNPYAESVGAYHRAGWAEILPLPARRKASPPRGYTGEDGETPSTEQLRQWKRTHGSGNVGLRMPECIVGIDVDLYKPEGRATWGGLLDILGEPPATAMSTSRNDRSGIRLYRVPAGTMLENRPGVEIIARHHRYAVVWPSIHPEGAQYRWIDSETGEILDEPPVVDELPELPEEWIEALSPQEMQPRQTPARQSTDDVTAFLNNVTHLPSSDDSIASHISASFDYLDALQRDGWQISHAKGDDTYLTRPGKSVRQGHSAVLHENAVLVVFTEDACVGHLARAGKRAKGGAGVALNKFDYFVATRFGGNRSEACRVARAELTASRDVLRRLDETADDAERGFVPTPSAPWETPMPLLSAGEKLPTFPVEALPRWIAAYAAEIAETRQVPIDMPCMSMIGAAAAVSAGRAFVNPNPDEPDDLEPTNLYLAVIAHSGAGKSPVDKAATKPIREIESEMIADHERADSAAGEARIVAEQAERKAKSMRDALTKASEIGPSGMFGHSDITLADIMLAEAAATEARSCIPPVPRIIADDATPEQISKILSETTGRLSLMSPESALFDHVCGTYARSANIDVFLKGFSGEPLRIDRKGTDKSGATAIRLERVHLTVSVAAQPAAIRKLTGDDQAVGRGFVQRFQFSWPRSIVGRRDMGRRFLGASESKHAADYNTRLRALARRMLELDAGRSLTLVMSLEARMVFAHWTSALEPLIAEFGDLEHMREPSSKLIASAIRMAGILHLLDGLGESDQIDEATAVRAITIGNYWLAHGGAVWSSSATAGDVIDAVHLVTWLAGRSGDEVTMRDMNRGLSNNSRFGGPQSFIPGLQVLLDRGWIRRVDEGGPLVAAIGPGKPSPRFVVAPQVSEWLVADQEGKLTGQLDEWSGASLPPILQPVTLCYTNAMRASSLSTSPYSVVYTTHSLTHSLTHYIEEIDNDDAHVTDVVTFSEGDHVESIEESHPECENVEVPPSAVRLFHGGD